MSLHVRQLGWLAARPKHGKTPLADRKRRIDRFAPGEAPLPPNPAPWLTHWLFEAGPEGSGGGMGAAALSWPDIEAWKAATGADPRGWEAAMLRRLSAEYVAQRGDDDPAAPPPWAGDAPTADRRETVAAGLGAMLKGRAKK